jgi:hypothetical protein
MVALSSAGLWTCRVGTGLELAKLRAFSPNPPQDFSAQNLNTTKPGVSWMSAILTWNAWYPRYLGAMYLPTRLQEPFKVGKALGRPAAFAHSDKP